MQILHEQFMVQKPWRQGRSIKYQETKQKTKRRTSIHGHKLTFINNYRPCKCPFQWWLSDNLTDGGEVGAEWTVIWLFEGCRKNGYLTPTPGIFLRRLLPLFIANNRRRKCSLRSHENKDEEWSRGERDRQLHLRRRQAFGRRLIDVSG